MQSGNTFSGKEYTISSYFGFSGVNKAAILCCESQFLKRKEAELGGKGHG